MATYRSRTFIDETITLDGNSYITCEFFRCRLIYAGGDLPKITAPGFSECQWELTEQAGRVLILLRALHAHGWGPAQQAIEFIQGSPRHDWIRANS